MNNSASLLDGNSWEANVKRWLRLRYPNDFQDVPATDRGDGGIECYCISDSNVYQCYAALETLDTRSLYENQRDKLTRDIGKFITNSSILRRTLPRGFKTRRYCFLVPELRSRELVAHAQTKAQEVRDAMLDYIADDFSVIVQTKDNFEVEQKIETAKLLKDLKLEIDDDIGEHVIENWVVENNLGVQNLDRKIPLFTGLSNRRDIESQRRYWIERKICTDNALESLRSHSSDAWEKLWAVKIGRERLLGKDFRQFGSGAATVESISDKVSSDMIEQVPNLAKLGAETLAEGLVGEWLQNCKLNFPSRNDNDSQV